MTDTVIPLHARTFRQASGQETGSAVTAHEEPGRAVWPCLADATNAELVITPSATAARLRLMTAGGMSEGLL